MFVALSLLSCWHQWFLLCYQYRKILVNIFSSVRSQSRGENKFWYIAHFRVFILCFMLRHFLPSGYNVVGNNITHNPLVTPVTCVHILHFLCTHNVPNKTSFQGFELSTWPKIHRFCAVIFLWQDKIIISVLRKNLYSTRLLPRVVFFFHTSICLSP